MRSRSCVAAPEAMSARARGCLASQTRAKYVERQLCTEATNSKLIWCQFDQRFVISRSLVCTPETSAASAFGQGQVFSHAKRIHDTYIVQFSSQSHTTRNDSVCSPRLDSSSSGTAGCCLGPLRQVRPKLNTIQQSNAKRPL